MKAKYVEERYPRVVAMGYYGDATPPDENITTVNDNFNVRVIAKDAPVLVAYYGKLSDALERMADAFDKANPEAFKAFWYGSELERK
jgi:hypothetical protein